MTTQVLEPQEHLIAPVSNLPTKKSRLKSRTGNTGATPVVPLEKVAIDRRRLCEDILGDGFVQSFVDFFYLTHRPEPNLDKAPTILTSEVQVSPQDMVRIRDNLTQAESARRQGDTGTVYGAYSALAQHFHSISDPRTGVYFYEKCLEIARLTNDRRGEMASNHDLGLIFQSMKEPAIAAKYHERHLTLAEKEGSDEEKRTAAIELVKVYQALAEVKESADENDSAIQVTILLFFVCVCIKHDLLLSFAISMLTNI